MGPNRNAFSEVLYFGLAYMVLFYVVVLCWLRITTSLFVQVGGPITVLFGVPSPGVGFLLSRFVHG